MANPNGRGTNKPSVGQMLWAYFGALSVMLTALLLFIFLGDRRFGMQTATIASYTLAVSFSTFSRTRGFDRAYSLLDKAVQKRIPRLLAIHGAFLVLVLALQASFAAVRPHLPAYWFTEDTRHLNLFAGVTILIYVLTGMTQILISRKILSRSISAEVTAGNTSAS